MLSLLGLAAMTPVTLLQMGMIRHLPDPPIDGFDSDEVNLSDTAFGKGTPDGTVAMVSFALHRTRWSGHKRSGPDASVDSADCGG